MRFDQRTCRTLPSIWPHSAPRGELNLEHFGTLAGALAYKKDDKTTGAAYHLRYEGSTALTGHYLAVILPRVGTRACLLYTSPSPRDLSTSRMPSSA